ncbi:MAG: hypothetical protein HYV33_03130 [Candidatus Kerfeldbacteria bacterium]|nr:hypothetical protein [Candidatus Kerfeldbacteria bacterium]
MCNTNPLKSHKTTLAIIIGIGLLLTLAIGWRLTQNNSATIEEATGINGQEKIEQTDISNSWVYVTNKLKLIIAPNGNCAVTWIDREPGNIELHTFNATGQKRILDSTIDDASCIVGEDISTLNYIGITVDDVNSGGLEPPIETDGSNFYHLMFTLPDNPTTLYPTSGQWNYKATQSSANLDCAVATGGFTAEGPVQFATSNYGFTASLSTASAAIHFTRQGYASPHYETLPYNFPIPEASDYGTVSYELDVLDQEIMKGTLHLQGDVCSGDFPIEMTLQAPSGPPIYVPHQGSWNVQYAPLACGSSVVNPANVADLPFNFSTLSITGGGPAQMQLNFDGSPGDLFLTQTSVESNLYTSWPLLWLGTVSDPSLGAYNLFGSWTVTALSDSLMIGTLAVTGTNGCSGGTTVQFEQF